MGLFNFRDVEQALGWVESIAESLEGINKSLAKIQEDYNGTGQGRD